MENTVVDDAATKLKNKNSEYYKKNLAKIKTKSKCDICSGSYTTYNKSKHAITKKHQKKLNLPNEPPTQIENNN